MDNFKSEKKAEKVNAKEKKRELASKVKTKKNKGSGNSYLKQAGKETN